MQLLDLRIITKGPVLFSKSLLLLIRANQSQSWSWPYSDAVSPWFQHVLYASMGKAGLLPQPDAQSQQHT